MIYYQNNESMNSKKRETLASHLDEIIAQGGTWEYLETDGNKYAIRLGFKTRCTLSIYKAQIVYRRIKDDNYLGSRIITDEGIMLYLS
jgi:hypothetical protein